MESKRVLVLMSSYNGSMYIEDQIRSIMLQETEYQVDLRIRDDGSTDNTCLVIGEMQRKYPGRVELVKGDRVGYNASFFILLNEASGYKYYALSDQDDYWLPNKIQISCEHLDRHEDDKPLLYASRSYLVRDDMQPYGKTRAQRRELSIYNTIIQNICPGHTQVLNNSLLELLKRSLDVSKIYVYDAWITNISVLYGKVIFDNNAHTLYRQHKNNQLGAGVSRFGRLLRSWKRIGNGDGFKYRRQIEYFVLTNKPQLLKNGVLLEIEDFIKAQSFSERAQYIFRNKFFRQSSLETIAFLLALLMGKF